MARVGTRIDRYEILSPLGAGGMGEVYLALDTRLNRKLALKLLPGQYTKDPERVRRFEQEAKAASALNHPSIITIYEIGEVGEVHFIAAEFIDGQTLRRQMLATPMGLREVLEVATQVASALAAAHAAKIVHRDIKPENIMVRPDGVVKVLDFGLAKLTEHYTAPVDTEAPTSAGSLTEPGAVMGTVTYMSPEQTRGREVDARTDIFSLGVVLYEMIAGRLPFTGATASDIMAAILMLEPPPLAQSVPELPAEMQRIVSKALRKDQEERYQTSKDLLIDLKDLKQELEFEAKLGRTSGMGTQSRTGSVKAEAASRMAGWRSAPLLGLILFLIVAVLGVAVWFLVRDRQQAGTGLPSLRPAQLANWKATASEPFSDATFSPDGKMIAYSLTKAGSNSRSIWLKLISEGEPIQFTKDEWGYSMPLWSRDGQQIAFYSKNRGDQAGIWRTSVLGEMPTLLVTLPKTNNDPRLKLWSKDRQTIYYESNRNLFALNVTSGQVTQVTHFDPVTSAAQQVNLSPGEDRIAYVDTKDKQSDIWVIPMRGGPPVQVTNDAAVDQYPVWHPDGKRIIYSSNRDGTYQICAAYLDGRQPLPITSGESDCFVLGVSADGTKVLYAGSKEESDIWGVRIDAGEEFEVTSDAGLEFWPDISPDGKMIAFQAAREISRGNKLEKCSILTKPVEAEGQRAQLAANGFDPSWSPDGSKLAFLRSAGDLKNIWTVGAIGGNEKQLTKHGIDAFGISFLPYLRTQTRFYSWSPDGRSLIYSSKEPGEAGLRIISADGSGESKIISNPDLKMILQCPLWSPDGRRIAFTSELRGEPAGEKNTRSVWLAEAGAGKSEIIFRTESSLRLIGWFPSGNDLLLVAREGKGGAAEVSLIRVSAGGDGQRQIARLHQSVYFNLLPPNIRLSPDGRSIAFTSREDGRDNIWVIPAVGGQARKITANNDPRLYYSNLVWSPDGKTIYFGKQLKWSFITMLDHFR